jgi:hypothetical protein
MRALLGHVAKEGGERRRKGRASYKLAGEAHAQAGQGDCEFFEKLWIIEKNGSKLAEPL